MMASRGLFTSASEHWGTPEQVFWALDREFDFDLDPCPGDGWLKDGMRRLVDGLNEEWHPYRSAFVNPPYGRALSGWIMKALVERKHLDIPSRRIVMLIPSRTDTEWWHRFILPNAHEIRFLRGRIGFTGVESKPERDRQKQRSRAPFPSVVVVL